MALQSSYLISTVILVGKIDMNYLQSTSIRIPKGFHFKKWQDACRVGRNIYIFGGISLDHYAGKLMRFNTDEMIMCTHEALNKIPHRQAHACCLYSNVESE